MGRIVRPVSTRTPIKTEGSGRQGKDRGVIHMGRLTPVAGDDCVTQSSPEQTTITQAVFNPPPAIERIAGVRILRKSAEWKGVALRLADPAGDSSNFELVLTSGDGRSIRIATVDEDNAIALWRSCGQASGQPLLLEGLDGSLSAPYPLLGRVALGSITIRRRYAFLNGRRPRFLARRKTSRMPERPVMVRGAALFE
jgi:hypothetical protein